MYGEEMPGSAGFFGLSYSARKIAQKISKNFARNQKNKKQRRI
jgi:hypothetical protein